jgi:outer membrane protein assembly factor BamB
MIDRREGASFGTIVRLYRVPGAASPPLRACPAVDGSGVSYVAIGAVLLALDAADSTCPVRWSVALEGTIPGPVAIGDDGLARVHAGDGLWAFDSGGSPAWGPVPVGPPLGHAAPTVDRDGCTYIASYTGGLLRVEPDGAWDPNPFWQSPVRLDAPALLREGTLFAGGEDHQLHAITLTERPGRSLWAMDESRGRTRWAIQSLPAPAYVSEHGELWVVGGRDGVLTAFDADGVPVWQVSLQGPMLGSPVITPEGDLVIGVTRSARGRDAWGELVCVAAATGAVRWNYSADGPVESTPVIGEDGIIIFGDNAEIVHAVRTDGQPVASVHHGSPIRSALTLLSPGRLAIGRDDGTLAIVACPSAGLARGGWPKFRGDATQSGHTPRIGPRPD